MDKKVLVKIPDTLTIKKKNSLKLHCNGFIKMLFKKICNIETVLQCYGRSLS